MKTNNNDSTNLTQSENVNTSVSGSLWTVPNALSAIRLIGAPVLAFLAIRSDPFHFLILYLILAMTDWVDGKLAILLKQRSTFGAQLDAWADVSLYSALLFGIIWLRGDVVADQFWWIVPAVGTYGLSITLAIRKFGRWPSYHNRAAKISWLLVLVGVICLLLDRSIWPFRIAMIAGLLTNIEACAITLVLPAIHVDVPSIYHALKIARTQRRQSAE